ncbi:MAG: maleylpyruvate isomerase N-terminal domain-containing protein [Actinomycetota bacterium]
MTLDRTTMLGIAHAERERLGRTIQFAPPGAWESTSVCDGWRNRDIVAHLAAQETAVAQLLAGDPATEFVAFREANGGELWVSGFNEWAVRVRDETPVRQVITDWGKAADAFLALGARLSEDEWRTRRVEWVAGEIGVRYLVQSRVIEWWLHGEDLREGTGLGENPQHWPVYLTNDLAIRMLPYSLGLVGLSFPGRSVQVDLEGVGEGSWHWGLAPRETPPEDKKPDAFVEGRGLAFALVAGRRHEAEAFLDDGNLVVGGDEDLALAVLANLRAFVE